MPKVTKNKIIWDAEDWFGELDQTSATTYNKKGIGIAQAQAVDPMHFYGYICPGFNPVAATNVSSVTGYIRNAVVDGSSAYGVTNDAMIQHMTSLNSTLTVDTIAPFPHTISGATNGQDIVSYYMNVASVRTKYFFYSWKDGSNGNIGAYDFATFTDNWLSTVPANAGTFDTDHDHPLVVGDDDIMYAGDGNNVHAIDGATGANGTLSKNVLTLPQGWVITSFAKTNDYKLAVGAYYSSSATGSTYNLGQAKVFVWDYLSLDPTYIYNLNDNYISELVNWRGTLLAFTQGRMSIAEPNLSKLQVLQGSQFSVLLSYQYGSTPCRGGVDIINDDILWNAGGRLYTYSRIPKSDQFILNSPIGLSLGSGSSGMCKIFSNSLNIAFSYGNSDPTALSYARAGTFSSGTLNTKTAYLSTDQRKRGRMLNVLFKFMEATTDANGRQLAISTIVDKVTSNFLLNGDPTVGMEELYFHNLDTTDLGDFTTLSFEVVWNGGSDTTKCPVIDSIIVEYQEVNIPEG